MAKFIDKKSKQSWFDATNDSQIEYTHIQNRVKYLFFIISGSQKINIDKMVK